MVDSIVLPADLHTIIGADRAGRISQSSGCARLCTEHHLLFDYPTAAQAENAAARLNWLSAHAPTPEVAARHETWLVTTRPDGQSAGDPELHAEPGHLASRLAKALRQIHSIDPDSCPYSRTWQDYAAAINVAIKARTINPEQLPDPYCRYTVVELEEMFASGRPPVEDSVVALGAPTVDDFYFEGDALTGIIPGPTLGVAERNADLAWLHRGVRENYGDEAVFSYYDSYGPGENLVAIDNFFLASILLA